MQTTYMKSLSTSSSPHRPHALIALALAGALISCVSVPPASPAVKSPNVQQSVAARPDALRRVTAEERKAMLDKRWLQGGGLADNTQARALLQQGWHEQRKLVFWHLPAVGAPDGSMVEFKVGACDAREEQTRVMGYQAARYEVEVVARPGCAPLQPGTTYTVEATLSGGETLGTFSATTAPADDVSEPFSFLTFSCMEPFATKPERTPIRFVNSLNLFKHRATGAWAPQGLPPRPAFALGLGDQMYVDAGPDRTKPLALFHGPRSNELAFNLDEAATNLQLLYRYHFAVPPLDAAMRAMPTMMMWDDHEIRDGWGSHGDEKLGHWPAYFDQARRGFLANEAQRNPGFRADASTADFSFRYGKQVKALVLDTRSCREISCEDPVNRRDCGPSRALCDSSRERVAEWLRVTPDSPPTLFILGLSTVFSMNETRFANAPMPELADDVADGWGSRAMSKERAWLIEVLEKHFIARPADRLLVVSGDVHESGVVFLTLEDQGKRRIFGHEVISSGLAADKMNVAYASWLASAQGPLGRSMQSHIVGSVRAANFAEIFIKPGTAARAPLAHVTFYPSAQYAEGTPFGIIDGSRSRLANPASLVQELTQGQPPEFFRKLPYEWDGKSLGVSIIELGDGDALRDSLSKSTYNLHYTSTLCWLPSGDHPNMPATSWDAPTIPRKECSTAP